MARKFQFRLQTLLRVRELREREAQRKVSRKLSEIAQEDDAIARLESQIRAHFDACLAEQRCERPDARRILRERAWSAHLQKLSIERQARRSQLLAELDPLRQALRDARVQTRMLEKLRERRLSEYQGQRDRHEQAETDEVARGLLAFGPTAQRAGSRPSDAAVAVARHEWKGT